MEQFGDLIIWKEILNISNEKEKNILFVSDDRKEDWCEKFKGIDLGPRKELIREFYECNNKLFYSVTTKDFIKYMSEIYTIKETEKLQEESDIIFKELYKNDVIEQLNDLKEYIDLLNNRKNTRYNNYLLKKLNNKEKFKVNTDWVNILENGEELSYNDYLSKVLNDERQAKINTDLVSTLDNKEGLIYDDYLSRVLNDERKAKINTDLVNTLGNKEGLIYDDYLSKVLNDEIRPNINTDLLSTLDNRCERRHNDYLSKKLGTKKNYYKRNNNK
nr:PIN-like domain-containing protein [Clostridium sp.]